MSKESFAKKKKDELVSICKEKGLPISGTKADLIARIFGEAPPAKATKRAKTKPLPAQPITRPCYKLISKRYIHAPKNEYGNYEDPESHLIFDFNTGNVLGKQLGAEVTKLSIDDVKFCHEKGLHFDASVFDGNFASKGDDIEELVEKLIATAEAVTDDEEEEEE